MLIWIAVVGTVLGLVGIIAVWQLILLVMAASVLLKDMGKASDSVAEAADAHVTATENTCRIFGKQMADVNDRSALALEKVFAQAVKDFALQADRSILEWKQVSGSLQKSQEELANSLAALLGQIRISKQLAQGTAALGEQTISAIEKLWKLIELARQGPRTATSVAPTDDQIAEGAESQEQLRAIQEMLQGVSQSVRGELNEQQ